MSTILALLLIATAWALLLVALNRHDGLRPTVRPWASPGQPPRSHARDPFDPALR